MFISTSRSKIFKDDIVTLYYGTATITAPIIVVIFILKMSLYDELRHLLFIFPLIFITSLSNLFYFFKENIQIFINFTNSFFSENINLNPYQYTWLNSFAKLIKLKKF